MCTGVATGIDLVRSGLARLTAADMPGLSDEQVRAEVLDLLACLNQLTGALLDRIAAFDRRDLAQVDAQRASSTWLVDFGRVSKGAALRWLAHARCLAKLPALAAGLRRGVVSAEQVAKVADLARHIGVDQVREYDEILAELSANAGPVEVEKACARIWALVDPDGAEPDPLADFDRREIVFSRLGAMMHIRGRLDPEGAAALQTAVDALMRPPTPGDERTAAQRRADAVVDLARGALASGALPEIGGERPHIGILVTPQMLFGDPPGAARHATGRLAPGHNTPDREAAHHKTLDGREDHPIADRQATHHTGHGHPPPLGTVPADPTTTTTTFATPTPATTPTPTPATTTTPAMTTTTATTVVPTPTPPRTPTPPTTTPPATTTPTTATAYDHERAPQVRVEPSSGEASGGADDPLTRAGVPPRPERPWLSWVGEVPGQLAQRLACDGTVWRLVLDPRTGMPLDVGRKIRIVPWWIRKAIRARDRTCRWPGCDVPSEWTDAHHLIPWWRGGETSAAQAISLCRYHHTLLHEGRWALRLHPATGEVRVWRPDGRPYELGPSRPWVSPARQRPPEPTGAG